MPKSVNVILNSNNAVSGNTQQANYYIDWNAVLDRKKSYYMHFIYMGGPNTYDGAKLPTIYANFNTNNVIANGSGAQSSHMIGLLMPSVMTGGTKTYLQSLDNTNLPIYLEVPPNNNNFTISILDNSIIPLPWTDSNVGGAEPPGPYVLILRFTEVNDSEE